jgi:5-methylcytosine-specific restriction protein A
MARTHGHGNPKWTRDETILALDLYLQCADRLPTPRDPRVIELSSVLQRLPYHGISVRKESFRNPDGVAFKLQNIHQVATGQGLENYSEMDRKVWDEFSSQHDKVRQLAALIRTSITMAGQLGNLADSIEDDEFFEGQALTRIHKLKERNATIRKLLLASRRQAGQLTCEMCSSPSKSLDPMCEDATFEAHHLVPLSMGIERRTRVSEMALLCANCHSLLHRAISINRRWLTIAEGRQIVRQPGNNPDERGSSL